MSSASWRSILQAALAAITALVACIFATSATAAPPRVEVFDAATWERLQQELPRPSAIVFTATYCSSCPAVIGTLADALAARGVKGEVVAVVIDAVDERELLRSAHYERASRLFLFNGNEASLRHGVDPRWRGITPYVALLPTNRTAMFTAGAPKEAQVATWLRQ